MNNPTIEPSIFKAYDIRGVYPTEIDEASAYLIARSYATFLKNKFPETTKVLVGSDMRVSSPSLKSEVIRGLLDSGLNVDDAGLLSTPSFYFAVAFYGYDGGLQISASHNPKEYNGIKIVSKGAVPVGRDTGISEIRDNILSNQLIPLAEQKGSLNSRENVVEAEVEQQLQNANEIKPFKVVIDAANSMGSLDMQALFSKLNCEVIKMNFDLDGTFPAHEADPMKEENLEALKSRVIQEKADLGIASDGDGDRYFFVDEKGGVVEQSIIRGLVSKLILEKNPGAKIGYDVRPGRITKDIIDAARGVAVLTPVGHALIKKQMIEEGIVFAGESSGHFYFKLPYGVFEAPMVLVSEILHYLSQTGKPFSEAISEYRKYSHSPEINIPVSSREEGLQKIEKVKEVYSQGQQNSLDGLSLEYPDFWFTLRLSNTEPLIRFAVEGVSPEIVKEKTEEIKNLLTN